jgi:hypothetical protein
MKNGAEGNRFNPALVLFAVLNPAPAMTTVI